MTSLEAAKTPGLDEIASRGVCGLMYTIGRGYAPESDVAVISILGYEPFKYYTGRGPLEALGAGMSLREGFEVAFRANFATIDPSTMRIIDRRVGRSLSSEEARKLAASLDGIDLGVYEGYARVRATVGHRAVVIIGSRSYRLSGRVGNSDPAYTRKGLISVAVKDFKPFIKPVEPLDDTPEARRTAELANRFTRIAVEVLDKHPVNEERKRKGLLPANAILLRDAGDRVPRFKPSLAERFGVKPAIIAEMPVEIGIGRAMGMHVVTVEPGIRDPERDYGYRLEKTLELLRQGYSLVYVHLKGPDEPGHDGDMEEKKRRIEEIDEYYVQPLLEQLPSDTAVLVTADHATPPSARSHTDDPVPVALMAPDLEPDDVREFNEKECRHGGLGVIEHGWLLLPRVFSLLAPGAGSGAG